MNDFYEYWRQSIESRKGCPVLPLMNNPCTNSKGEKDCAVVCGLYQEYSEALKQESAAIQLAVSQKWFCHNHPNKACRGNADYLGIKW